MRLPIIGCIFLFLACGGKSSHSNPVPESKDDPGVTGNVQNLPDGIAEELQVWLAKPQKSCDVSAIFSGLKSSLKPLEESYDLSFLLKAMGQKLWLTNAAGDTLLLSKPFGPSHTGFNNNVRTINGNSLQLHSNLDFDGTCTIEVNGKLVAKLTLTSGFGVAAYLPASRQIHQDHSQFVNFGEAVLKDNKTLINPNALSKVNDLFSFNVAAQSSLFTIPGYNLESLLIKLYNPTPDQIIFRGDKQNYRGWFASLGGFDFLPRLKPSWSEDTVTYFDFVPALVNSTQLSLLQAPQTLPLEWTLEFTAWEAGEAIGTWQPVKAQVGVKAQLKSFANNTSVNPSQSIAIHLTEIETATFGKVEANELATCLDAQTTFWLDAIDGQVAYSPEATLFPCERLVGSEKKVSLIELYSSSNTLRASLQRIWAGMSMPASRTWLRFHLNLATAVGSSEFPFPGTGFTNEWKRYFDFYKARSYDYKTAITLSAWVVHGNRCHASYSETPLTTFAQEFVQAATAGAQDQALVKLRRTCLLE